MKWTLRPTGIGRTRRTLFGAIGSLLLLGVIAVPNAAAVHDLGLFELDRNAEDQVAAGDDWDTLPGGGEDDFSGILADIGADGGTQFQGGGSKDDLDITQLALEERRAARQGRHHERLRGRIHEHGGYRKQRHRRSDRLLRARPVLDRGVGAGGLLVPARPGVRPQQHALRRGIQVQRPSRGRRHPRAEQLLERRCDLESRRLPVAIGRSRPRSLASPTPSECNPTPPATLDGRPGVRNREPVPDGCAVGLHAESERGWPWQRFQTSAFFEGGINISQLIPERRVLHGVHGRDALVDAVRRQAEGLRDR